MAETGHFNMNSCRTAAETIYPDKYNSGFAIIYYIFEF